MQNVILHLDMNSYFASCEQQDNLALRGKPVGVCEHLGGIIIGASVEAKKWGITTGTPVWEAKKLYPKIILTHTHPDRYRYFTKQMIKVVSDYTDKVEVYSIDEVFADLTKVCNVRVLSAKFLVLRDPFEEAVSIAQEIKKRITAEVGDWLRCSVGIAENKLIAKIASDMKKPDGLVVIIDKNDKNDKNDEGQIILSKNSLYDRLRLTDVPGIGRRMEKRLAEMGIHTLIDLRDYPKSKLVAAFGIPGYHLYSLGQLQGTARPEVEEDEDIKSIGHMYTLPAQFRDRKFFAPVLYKLSEMVAKRLRNQNLTGSVLGVHVHDIADNCFGKSKRLRYRLQDGREIFLESLRIIESLMRGKEAVPAGYKLIGIVAADLSECVNQLSLFGSAEREKRLTLALDEINEKYGDFTVCRVPVMSAGKVIRDSVGFGRVKEL